MMHLVEVNESKLGFVVTSKSSQSMSEKNRFFATKSTSQKNSFVASIKYLHFIINEIKIVLSCLADNDALQLTSKKIRIFRI
jgi:hypothetical protein